MAALHLRQANNVGYHGYGQAQIIERFLVTARVHFGNDLLARDRDMQQIGCKRELLRVTPDVRTHEYSIDSGAMTRSVVRQQSRPVRLSDCICHL
jgi:hypothetical protein